MPVSRGLDKSLMGLDSSPKQPPLIKGNPVLPVLRPLSEFLKIISYIFLWEEPALSAFVFIWLNISIVSHVTFGISFLLSATVSSLLLLINIILVEHSLNTNSIALNSLKGLLKLPEHRLEKLPGADEFSRALVMGVNSVAEVFQNIKDSSKQGKTQFWFALSSTTTFLLFFWMVFCFPAAKHHRLHHKISQEQALIKVVSTNEAPLSPAEESELDGQLHTDVNTELTEPLTLRQTTLSYLRGLPSVMTLNWGWGKTWSRGVADGAAPTPTSTTSTEEDSDYGIDEIQEEEDVGRGRPGRALTTDTLGSYPEGLIFPDPITTDRKDTLDLEQDVTLLGNELDRDLLYDADDATDGGETMETDTLGIGLTQQLELLDAVLEHSGSEGDDRTEDPSPSPIYGNTIVSSSTVSKGDTLDGRQVSFHPSPPTGPPSRPAREPRVQRPSSASATTEDSEFHVISDEEIRAADDEISSNASSVSLRERIANRVRQISGSENPVI